MLFDSSTLRRALQLLSEARTASVQNGQLHWQFAVELSAMVHVGATCNLLRELILKGHIEHRVEITQLGSLLRQFAIVSNLALPDGTCFIITDQGFELSRQLHFRNGHAASHEQLSSLDSADCVALLTPHWHSTRRELTLGERLVKRFKVPAPVQELLLAAFEEEGWPDQITDPLPRCGNQEPKRRLHEAIKGLNRRQRDSSIRFYGDGTGQGIRWELRTKLGNKH